MLPPGLHNPQNKPDSVSNTVPTLTWQNGGRNLLDQGLSQLLMGNAEKLPSPAACETDNSSHFHKSEIVE